MDPKDTHADHSTARDSGLLNRMKLGLFPSRRHKESSSARGADASHGHDQRTQSKAVGSKDTVDAEHETAWSWIKRNLSAKALVSMFLLSLLLVEAALIIVIIARVEYTQIDWSTYMQQVSAFMAGELDYKNLHGDTGPLVYPAGFLYVYSLLYVLTGGGKYILLAQIIFGGIYITTLFVVILLYRRSQIFPIWAIPLLMLSRRNHSIYMLRLFNDPIAMLFMFSSILALTKRQYERASIWFSLALSIKMNVLLFAPGMAWVFFFNAGLVRSAMNAGLVLVIQVILAAPFLYSAPKSYLTCAFDFSRQFLHRWTVNWRFVPEDLFSSSEFAMGLLALHILALVLFATTVWRRHIPRHYHCPRQHLKFLDFITKLVEDLKDGVGVKHIRIEDMPDDVVSPDDTILILFSSNLIGIMCARSLHYQFYSWYCFTLPYLLWRSGIDVRAKLALFFLIEWAWNVYPSTNVSSGALLLCHLIIVASLVVGHPVHDALKPKAAVVVDQDTVEKNKHE
ncbi:hypothetical protein BASA50_003510 [Batrachochytrium salamandrivorans]|uniref:Dol-P-Man:Man(5)GlcNAc(2)-PP-Dol alpha-1,3-mannosyltransferase n=1 Tax=Batrachochytrium salamandrivorans TaxID=1357716 RepID=A0ABQ8FHN9_9FUNG|nr:hypothetical protein BASA62_003830 [Batrachochytrium salamandrivorans]KAH6572148.1 hypothetical protein BASA60_006760 [Batrachochytrium salamandrivorans]KAH6598470.1 hypothetical protein BASA50_003510 [Batrachochytrium salamandrivorans]KAH6599125.1 hypothetical protein BASA61_002656 [Batrachochytrium salamandrivorans]